MTEARPLVAPRISTARVLLVLGVLLYVGIFNLTYRDLVSPIFAFFGFGYSPPPPLYLWTSVVLCVIPACWMPLTFARPSLLLFYVQYLLIFIPAAFIVYHSIRPVIDIDEAFRLVILMFAGLSIMQSSYLLPVRGTQVMRLTPEAFWTLFSAAGGIMLMYLVVTLSGNFRLANFIDIYDVRYAMAETLDATGSRFGYYAQYLLFDLFLPILFVVGAFARKRWLLVLVALTYVFLFGIGGAKAAILALLYLPMFYLLLRQPPHRVPHLFVLGLVSVQLLGYPAVELLGTSAYVSYLGVVHFRMFSVPAITIPQYFDFFQTHPVTHLAQVTGFNRLLTYQYEQDIPYTIGRFFYGASIGMNSGTWAADGLAGFGPWGIVLMSLVVAIVFWVIDSAAAGIRVEVAAVMIAISAVSFGSVSLFTTLITGGLAFVILALLVAPRDGSGMLTFPTLPDLRARPATSSN